MARRSTNGNTSIKRNKDVSKVYSILFFYYSYHLVLPPFFFFFLFAFLLDEALAGLDGLVSALGDEDELSVPRLPPMLALPVPPIPPPATKVPCGPLPAAFLFLPFTR